MYHSKEDEKEPEKKIDKNMITKIQHITQINQEKQKSVALEIEI